MAGIALKDRVDLISIMVPLKVTSLRDKIREFDCEAGVGFSEARGFLRVFRYDSGDSAASALTT